jgi:hypothetical protein
MRIRLGFLTVLLFLAAVRAADDPFLTPNGVARPATLTYAETEKKSGSTDEWTRRISVEVTPDGISALRVEHRGGREILRNRLWLTEVQYRTFTDILRRNGLLELREADLGMRGFESNPCEIRVSLPGAPEWLLRFTALQAGRRRELQTIRQAFLDLVPPVDEHHRHDTY